MPRGHSLVFVALLLSLAGCGFHATRYTWVGNESKLAQTNLECARDMQRSYVPVESVPALYKDCVEKHGYLRIGTDKVALVWDEQLSRWRPEPACGKPDQTCLWVEPSGGRWGIAPLPSR